jgi:selenium-binding protein 1
MAKITGQEEFLYVWTLGMEGVGDGSDWDKKGND